MADIKRFTDLITEKYHPLALVVYGSFIRGDNDEYSDFDCLLIVKEKSRNHDGAVIDGIPLDCFIYTKEETETEAPDTFLPMFDGIIVCDTDGIAATLKERVRNYVSENSVTSQEDKEFLVGWIRKTMRRAEKGDDEGSYRALAFLWESLADYGQLRDMFYFGSKKAAAYLKAHDPAGYRLYHTAVTERTNAAIAEWAEHVCDIG